MGMKKVRRNGSQDGNEDNIKVVVRARPMNDEEKRLRQPCLVTCDQETRSVAVSQTIGNKVSAKTYHFDTVFSPYSSQEEVYTKSVKPIVQDVLLGYNCTVFAYGQTGTGKTYTMEGQLTNEMKRGMIPRAVDSIFDQLPRLNHSEFSAKVSFLELYNEELFDLLTDNSVQPSKGVRLVDDKSKQVCCQNLTEILVNSSQDVLKVMEKALSRRQTAETKLNKASSRSHCIFTLTLHIRERTVEGEDLVKVGKLNLVDLAGSESVGRAGGNDKRMREAGNINKSLLTLGRVITALVEKTPHIPYRDSKLTRLLQESLGGRAKTLVIATVGPSLHSLEETISTLDYASRAKSIKNKPKANKKLTKHELIKEYVEDMERMRKELEAARSKDGVWLSQEQYDEMRIQIDTQEKQISSMEAGLSGREEEVQQKNEEISQLNEKLEASRLEIERLEQVRRELEDTVAKQAYKIEEKSFVIEKHVGTEKQLTTQVDGLKRTIQVCVTDIQLLERKVAKQSQLEVDNFEHIGSFSNLTTETLNTLNEASLVFQKQHSLQMTDLLEASKKECESNQHKRDKLAEAVQVLVKNSIDKQADIYNEHTEVLTRISAEDLNNLRPFLTEKVKHWQHKLRQNQELIVKFKESVVKEVEKVLADRIESFSKNLTSNVSEMNEKYQQQETTLKNLVLSFVSRVNELKQEQDKCIEAERKEIVKFQSNEQKRWNEMQQELETKFKTFVEDMKEQSLATLSQKLTSEQQVLTTLTANVDTLTSHGEKFDGEVKTVVESLSEELDRGMKDINTGTETFKNETSIQTRRMVGALDAETKRAEEEVTEVEKELSNFEEEHNQRVDTIRSAIEESVTTLKEKNNSVEQMLESEKDDITASLKAQNEAEKENYRKVESNILTVKEKTEGQANLTLESAGQVLTETKKLTHDRLKKYEKSSPQTPHKKTYDFDRNSYNTESLDVLKEKFRVLNLNILSENTNEEVELSNEENEPRRSSLQNIFEKDEEEEEVPCVNKENVEPPNYDSLKVKELRSLLSKKGLSQVGRKEELKRRLIENS